MNDQTQAKTPPDKLSLEDLSRAYFAASNPNAETAVARALAIAEAHNLPVSYNWKAESEPMPEGYDVAIVPVTKRTETSGNVPVALWIAAIPSLEVIASHDKGTAWIQDKIADACISKLANAVRPSEKKTDGPLSVPLSVDDFIIAATRDQGLATFRTEAAEWIKGLKAAGLAAMNPTLLRQVLSSSAFASQQFPKIPDAKWAALLDKMIAKAQTKSLDPGIMAVWKQTRTETTIGADDFDLEALDNL
jgi:hypothetical protein